MINIQNIDDLMIINALNLQPADHHPARIRKVGKLFEDKLDFENIKFIVKIRDIL